MSTDTTIWILGAPDPEMETIEALLRDAGERVEYAMKEDVRVHPGNAYKSDGFLLLITDPINGAAGRVTHLGSIHTIGPQPGDRVYLVECGISIPAGVEVVIIDHHRPGDPGHGKRPERFLPASSLGQVIKHLAHLGRLPPEWARVTPRSTEEWSYCEGAWYILEHHSEGYHSSWVSIPGDLVMAAAADHCLGAAYRGECPGVDPDQLMDWRVNNRANFQGRSAEDVMIDVEETRAVLHDAWEIAKNLSSSEKEIIKTHRTTLIETGTRWSVPVADMRREPPWPELPEAATRDGIPYISGPLNTPDDRQKFTCSGNEEVIKAFMDDNPLGLVDLYGDPARGFAGGYKPKA